MKDAAAIYYNILEMHKIEGKRKHLQWNKNMHCYQGLKCPMIPMFMPNIDIAYMT